MNVSRRKAAAIAVTATMLGTFALSSASAFAEQRRTLGVKVSASASVGSTVQLRSRFQAATTGRYVVDTEIYDSRGKQVTQFDEEIALTGKQTIERAYDWKTAGLSAGNYTIKQGLFTRNWARQVEWNNRAAVVRLTTGNTNPPVTTPPTTTPPTTPPTTRPPTTSPPTTRPPTTTPPSTPATTRPPTTTPPTTRPPTTTPPSTPANGTMFAPYTYPDVDLAANMASTGTKNYTLAFILGNGCTPNWDGTRLDTYVSNVNKLRAAGGDVIISFGGAGGNELGITCTDVTKLTAAYQSVVSTYGLKWVDFDIEGDEASNTSTLDGRSKAIANLQNANPGLQVSFTLAVDPSGLPSEQLTILRSAINNGVNIGRINIMAMDYGSCGGKMGTCATQASTATVNQMKTLFPSKTDAQRWTMLGVTVMIGQNDTKNEIFSLADAQTLTNFAKANHIGLLSMWLVGRDNGNCAGSTSASDSCSGVSQAKGAFQKQFLTAV